MYANEQSNHGFYGFLLVVRCHHYSFITHIKLLLSLWYAKTAGDGTASVGWLLPKHGWAISCADCRPRHHVPLCLQSTCCCLDAWPLELELPVSTLPHTCLKSSG